MVQLSQLTTRQREVYDYIRERIRSRGYGPTVREVMSHFGISSPNGVVCHLKALEKKGLILREPKMSRAITLAQEPAEEARGLPLLGRIAAGPLQEAVADAERVDFTSLFQGDDLFVLRVTGDSMIDAQIADGDFVIVRKQPTAHKGEIVVALTDENETTLKRWFPENGRIRLQPENAEMQPIYVQDARVLGIVVGVVRQVK